MMLEHNTPVEISNPIGSYCKMLLDPILQICLYYRLQDSYRIFVGSSDYEKIPIGFVSDPISDWITWELKINSCYNSFILFSDPMKKNYLYRMPSQKP
jgi:hypothetical protein